MRAAAALCACALVLLTLDARAFQPEGARVVDRLWSDGEPWLVVQNTTAWADLRVVLRDLEVQCDDPVAGRFTAAQFCAGSPQIDLLVHAFRDAAGELGAPLRCEGTYCEHTFPAPLAGAPLFALLVHEGPGGRGIVSGKLDVYAGPHLLASRDIRVSDEVLVDVADAPSGAQWEVHSVLVPDGPVRRADGPTLPGNVVNDHLGIAATEAWVLDDTFNLVGAETMQKGVGPAAFLDAATRYRYPTAAWVLVRPFLPLPQSANFEVRIPDVVVGGTTVVTWADHAKLPPLLSPDQLAPGRIRVVLNRLDDDWDGDGVSGAVEVQLRTCDGLHAFAGGDTSCPVTTDPAAVLVRDARDTDGDGLSDRAEILGSDVTWTRGENADGTCSSAAPSVHSDADQTFPLWAFDPRHKDALVEIDVNHETILEPFVLAGTMRRVRSTICLQGAFGCGPDSSVLYPAVIHDTEHPFELRHRVQPGDVLAQLRIWHDRYAALRASRVVNPDRRDGIELHFDALGHATWTIAHGPTPRFDVTGSDGFALPGLLVYAPPSTLGSNCSCRGAFSCPSWRHAGYSHYARLDSFGGGGQSGCNGRIEGALTAGISVAHEMGHTLGLGHGAPLARCAESHYPAGLDPFRSSEALNEEKIVFYSTMSYAYSGSPNATFSLGALAAYPLPRRNASGGFEYPEVSPFGGASTRFVSEYGNPAPMPQPSMCEASASSPRCVDADFDNDMTLSSSTGIVEPVPVGYRRGLHVAVRVPGMWCPEESRIAGTGVSSQCCNPSGTTLVGNACVAAGSSGPGPAPTNLPTSNTMLLAASPAVTIANGRAYTFFVDDLVSGDATLAGNTDPAIGATLPRRASPAPVTQGRVRWTAMADRLRYPASSPPPRRTRACLGEQVDCTAPSPGATQYGNVDAEFSAAPGESSVQPVTVHGTTVLAATTLRDMAGDDSHVLLAWTSRTGMSCMPRTDLCRSLWAQAQVRIAPVGQVESGPFLFAGVNGRFTFPPGYTGTLGVSGVAAVAWDPDPARLRMRTRALVFLRTARGAEDGNGSPLWYSLCGADGVCTTLERVRDAAGTALISNSGIAAALATVPAGMPDAGRVFPVLAFGTAELAAPGMSRLRVVAIEPDSVGGLVAGEVKELNVQGSGSIDAVEEGALSIAFADPNTQSSRLVIARERFEGNAGAPATWYTTSRAWPFASTGPIPCVRQSPIRWGHTRALLGSRNDAGTWISNRADAPGHVTTLYFDERQNISDLVAPGDAEELQYLERNVRGALVAQDQAGPTLLLRLVADPRPLVSYHDHDEVSALGHYLCPTTHASSGGVAFPDIRLRAGSPPGALGPPAMCPGLLGQARSSALVLETASDIMSICSGTCLFAPPPEVFDRIARAITAPGNYASLPTSVAPEGPLPLTPPHREGTDCPGDHGTALWHSEASQQ